VHRKAFGEVLVKGWPQSGQTKLRSFISMYIADVPLLREIPWDHIRPRGKQIV